MSNLTVSKRQRQKFIGGSLAVLVAIVIAVVSAGGGGDLASPNTNDEAAFDAEFELFDGGVSSFSAFRGKPLVLNFWASWCPACVGELPDFQAIHEIVGDDVTFIGMANADARGPAVELADEIGLTYTLADDPQGELFRSLGLFAMPSTVFITADGQIHDVFGGQLTDDALLERINELKAAS